MKWRYLDNFLDLDIYEVTTYHLVFKDSEFHLAFAGSRIVSAWDAES